MYIENNIGACVDMEFLFECLTSYLTSEHSEQVSYRVKHEKKNSISTSNHVSFCLLYKHFSNKKKLTLLTIQKRLRVLQLTKATSLSVFLRVFLFLQLPKTSLHRRRLLIGTFHWTIFHHCLQEYYKIL